MEKSTKKIYATKIFTNYDEEVQFFKNYFIFRRSVKFKIYKNLAVKNFFFKNLR